MYIVEARSRSRAGIGYAQSRDNQPGVGVTLVGRGVQTGVEAEGVRLHSCNKLVKLNVWSKRGNAI